MKKLDGKVRSTYQANVEAVMGQMMTDDPSWYSESAKEKPFNVNLHNLQSNLLFDIEQTGDRLVNKAA